MSVIHVLKDGSRVNDITGYVVRVSDASALYRLINDLNKRSSKSKGRKVERVR